uniref:Mitochondrial 2-oxodicarboxylate carrier n=1 Tax=Panagrolaimus superbus TaxID=310955 RepID=A0A914Y014_9BILA
MTEGAIVSPFETVKVKMQSDRSGKGDKKPKSLASVAREIIKKDGYGKQGLLRGLDATLARDGLWNLLYFGIYHNLKPLIPIKEGKSQPPVTLRFLLGFTASALASIADIPFDVVKSRIQGPQPSTGRIYHGVFQTMSLVVKNEGILALYAGMVPKRMYY